MRVDYSEPGWDHSKVEVRLLDHAERHLDLHQRERKGVPFFMHFCTDGGFTDAGVVLTIEGTRDAMRTQARYGQAQSFSRIHTWRRNEPRRSK